MNKKFSCRQEMIQQYPFISI